MSDDIFLKDTHQRVLKVLKQADYLTSRYHVVVANPPYMGNKGMNPELKSFVKDHYPDNKSDLFAAFIERNIQLVLNNGFAGFMTPFTWMFLSSYEKLRKIILFQNTLTSLIRPEYHAFFDSAYVPICSFTIQSTQLLDYKASFIDLSKFYGAQLQAPKVLEAIHNPDCGWFFNASAADFKKIPGNPVAYSIYEGIIRAFEKGEKLGQMANISEGVKTGNNERFLRYWQEVSIENFALSLNQNNVSDLTILKKWVGYHKGGAYRRWYGNYDFVINWENNGKEIKEAHNSGLQGIQNYFNEGIVWSKLSSSYFGVRLLPKGVLFDSGSPALFPFNEENTKIILPFLLSKIATSTIKITNPTLNFQVKNVSGLPFLIKFPMVHVKQIAQSCIDIASQDWDAYETSWHFTCLPLLNTHYRMFALDTIYLNLRSHLRKMTLEMQRLEEENNRIFIKAYGLEDELTPDVPLHEITLTCNPHYRYAQGKTEEEYETLLKADTMKELISYSVGCMMGRYSLDEPGLVYAHSGNEGFDPSRYKTFPADDDGVIPIMDVDWFPDDIAEQFKRFLKVTFGEEHYTENLEFIEKAIGKDIRKFFLKDFYTYHVKMYKKRPIYWLFSSPKGSFNALIYLHRYRPDTVSIVLNDYLREFRTKLAARKENLENISISTSASQGDKTKALKEIEGIKKVLDEVDEYERDILYPLATKRVEIDLDDGVKVNYPKFGKALKKVVGLS
ncbi:MAG: BREX-1 system adenine-specific DNA-methyltransferase PglX [Desulfamplus sp.]|nr:BREX-1 system adenine-specific DNA-methyltransferase PglX [Desulfamplus sp.]